MTSPTLTFLGGVGTVTGSRFLVSGRSGQALVDCGLYQGLANLRRRNWEAFPGDAAAIDAVVLTHAHLDHSGYLPRLVRDGFGGPIVCTADTARLATIVLRDSAHLMEEDARYANAAGFSRHRPALPLYDAEDVARTIPHFEAADYRARTTLGPGLAATLRPAGHILGSATALVEVDGARVLFSGDLGRPHHPLLPPPASPPVADAIVIESTYGDRVHPDPDPEVLASAIRRTVDRGGSVLVPAFAVDRTELVLLALARLRDQDAIPRVPIHIDSPMALAALDVYRHSDAGLAHGEGLRTLLRLLDSGDVHEARTANDSMTLNKPGQPCIVVSASGMATGGRVVHHLEHQLPDPRNTVVLTGFQAEGTRGRALRDGARQLKMHGRYVPVRAEIVQDEDFSVHADADEVLGWLAASPSPPRAVYVVHGEARASEALAQRIRDELDWTAVVPRFEERVRLD